MAREVITDEQVEAEIAELQKSPYVKLTRAERRLKNKRRMYLYALRQEDKRGREMAAAGITIERLQQMYATEELNEELLTEEETVALAEQVSFGKRVKHRLVDLDRTQEWLLEQIREKTGLFIDSSYLYKILTGQRTAPKIVTAIREILGLEDGDHGK